jgi:Protein of unknown function (DUF2934)
MGASPDPTQSGTAVEERERLLSSTREQEIRNRAYESYLQRGATPGYEVQEKPHGSYRHV